MATVTPYTAYTEKLKAAEIATEYAIHLAQNILSKKIVGDGKMQYVPCKTQFDRNIFILEIETHLNILELKRILCTDNNLIDNEFVTVITYQRTFGVNSISLMTVNLKIANMFTRDKIGHLVDVAITHTNDEKLIEFASYSGNIKTLFEPVYRKIDTRKFKNDFGL